MFPAYSTLSQEGDSSGFGHLRLLPAPSAAARDRPVKPVLLEQPVLLVRLGSSLVVKAGCRAWSRPFTFPSHHPAADGPQGISSVLSQRPDAHLGPTGIIGGPMGSLWFTTSLVQSPLSMSSDGFMKSTRTVTMCAEY